jgi:hypothetical protein
MPCRCSKTILRVDNPALKRMSPGRDQSCMETTAMVGLVGTLALRPDSLPHCSQPIPSVRRPSFTFLVLVAVSSLADLGYLSRPSLPLVALSLSKGLSTSSIVFLFPQYSSWSSLLVYICTVLPVDLCIVTVPSFWIIPTHDPMTSSLQ